MAGAVWESRASVHRAPEHRSEGMIADGASGVHDQKCDSYLQTGGAISGTVSAGRLVPLSTGWCGEADMDSVGNGGESKEEGEANDGGVVTLTACGDQCGTSRCRYWSPPSGRHWGQRELFNCSGGTGAPRSASRAAYSARLGAGMD